MKPGCQWRPKDNGYARVCETFAKENSTHEVESAQERVIYISERKAGRMGSSKLFEFYILHTELGTVGFDAFPVGFGAIIPPLCLIYLLCNGDAYSGPLYIKSV